MTSIATRRPAFFSDFNKDFEKYLIGFDNQWNRLSLLQDDIVKNVGGYPPYNIKKVDEAHYEIQMAVSGFSESDINITVENGKLTVTGNSKEESEDSSKGYIHKGIATRNFVRTFALNEQIDVTGASLVNGMLKIALEYYIPEHKKARQIAIGTVPETKPEPQLLVE